MRLAGWLLLLAVPLTAPVLRARNPATTLGVQPALWLSCMAIALPLASLR
jgi:hypothetical protein